MGLEDPPRFPVPLVALDGEEFFAMGTVDHLRVIHLAAEEVERHRRDVAAGVDLDVGTLAGGHLLAIHVAGDELAVNDENLLDGGVAFGEDDSTVVCGAGQA